jgi:hypothetical protein
MIPTVEQITKILTQPHAPLTLFGRSNELTTEEQVKVEHERQAFLKRRAERDVRWGTRR